MLSPQLAIFGRFKHDVRQLFPDKHKRIFACRDGWLELLYDQGTSQATFHTSL
jgi:hypothetical protein